MIWRSKIWNGVATHGRHGSWTTWIRSGNLSISAEDDFHFFRQSPPSENAELEHQLFMGDGKTTVLLWNSWTSYVSEDKMEKTNLLSGPWENLPKESFSIMFWMIRKIQTRAKILIFQGNLIDTFETKQEDSFQETENITRIKTVSTSSKHHPLSGTCVIPGLRKNRQNPWTKAICFPRKRNGRTWGGQRQCLEPIRRFSESNIQNRTSLEILKDPRLESRRIIRPNLFSVPVTSFPKPIAC